MFHIIMSADENYIKYSAVLITSIIKNTDLSKKFKDFCDKEDFIPLKNNNTLDSYSYLKFDTLNKEQQKEGYIFHILSNFISPQTEEKLQFFEKELNSIYPCKILIHIFEDEFFKDFPKSGAAHSNYLSYYRLKINSILDNNVKNCIYLDSDMLCFFDIRELFALDLKDKIIACVNDPGSKKRKIKFKEKNKKITFYFDQNYFNAGFLLINFEKYKKEKIEEKTHELAKKCFYIKAADQDLLNFVLRNQILKLDFAYNFSIITYAYAICRDENSNRLNFTREEFNQSFKNPKILHYGEKPWKYLKSYIDANGKNINDHWWEMVNKTPIFNKELLEEKNNIKEYLYIAALGFMALKFYNDFKFFKIASLIKNKNDKKYLEYIKEIKDEEFGLCCILGESIFYARKSNKGSFSVILKLLKIIFHYKKYSHKSRII
ncbi:glycosyltransferase family 8 protein [Campylobacter sp. TTU_617]|uniref:glycosyltransferase family 8 protein n=1 Tax=Campylobacter sp. TTU_617 TaxID=2768148 RepID=UPI0019052CDE|nr:glycosyltransferase [Campylobacter sp. TTU_617]MBK1971380.1 glycosyltransferase family 8 protein [Campylobacter sp. TTU_617]